MHALVTTLSVVNTLIFATLGAIALTRWRGRRDEAARWVALAFLSLALITTVGRLVPTHPHGAVEWLGQRIDIELLVLFPYLLYRFATVFVPPARLLQQVVGTLTVSLSVATFALPRVPAAGESRPASFVAYLAAFVAHWTLLSIVVAVRLWRAGRREPGVAASRMRMLAFASTALTVAIVGVAIVSDNNSPGAAVVQALALLSGIAFLFGLAPPALVRSLWRQPEQEKLQEAVRGLMTLATTRAEVAERVLAPTVAMVGARAAAVLDGDGTLVASDGLDAQTWSALEAGDEKVALEGTTPVRVEQPNTTLLVWTSPYAPFFGDEELALLRTVAALTGIALDRVRLFEQEHEARLALERANEVMTNFVSLAAHELRTPVTTIHGFVQTLHRLDDRLDEEQRVELRAALEQQTARMAGLVEQLLDLSRLDADAVQVRPQQLDLRARLHEVVSVAAGGRARDVVLDVPDSLDAVVDPSILDHIVTNLVTNAFRYGEPPVRVVARVHAGRVKVTVEDSGPGVAEELEETLFERFTRAGVTRDRTNGTGLGLAIARAYAHAHSGELHYERGRPLGARFVVELPSV